MSDDDIAELRRLLAAASPRPWKHVSWWDQCEDAIICEQDLALIAAAVNALPDLLDEVERLRAENARLRVALEHAWSGIGDRLLADGPLSKGYANAVMRDIDAALRGKP